MGKITSHRTSEAAQRPRVFSKPTPVKQSKETSEGVEEPKGRPLTKKPTAAATTQDQPMIPQTLHVEKNEPSLNPEDTQQIREYIRSFRAAYLPHLKKEISLQTHAVPYEEGVVIEVKYDRSNVEVDQIEPGVKDSIQDVFQELKVPIKTFLNSEEKKRYDQGVKEKALLFSGTGILKGDDKLYLIKDNYRPRWTQSAAQQDVQRILNP